MLTIDFIKHFVSVHADIAYILIVLGVILEGEFVVILAGIFSNLGSLNIFAAFLFVALGGATKAYIGYKLGQYLQKSHSHRSIVCKAEQRVHYFLPHFKERPFWSLFLSSFMVLGMNMLSLIYAGYRQVEVRTFVLAEAFAFTVWSVIMLLLGYVFSYTALNISHDVRKFLGLIILFLVAFFVLEKIVAFVLELLDFEDQSKKIF
jgi:membrane protein DedA with SNARE-associated domain